MSRVYFRSPTAQAEVHGPERANCAGITARLFIGLLGADAHNDPVARLLPRDAYPLQSSPHAPGSALAFRRDFDVWAGGTGTENHFELGATPDERETVMDAQMNTALVHGSRSLAFAARFHAQCEVHAYVLGPNRAWLADVIDEAVADYVLRIMPYDEENGWGWTRVAALLRSRNDEPIVLSDSRASGFPEPGWVDDEEADLAEEARWNEHLSDAQRWDEAFARLVAVNGLEWKPETFQTDVFGLGYTALSLREYANKAFPPPGSGVYPMT